MNDRKENQNSFSIIIPCYNKADSIARTLQSLISQTYDNYEVIVIDDGSTDDSKKIISSFMRSGRQIRAFFLPDNAGRIVARNVGMRLAKNDWICWLDADDEYMSNYLEVLDDEIKRNPDYKVFNTGMLVKEREVIDDVRYEKGWRIVPPLELKEEGEGMESFSGGQIGTGSFTFHRDVLKKIGYFPEDAKQPYGGDDSLPARWVERDPKMAEICKKNEQGQWLPLGNPWGDDYSFFWLITRYFKTKTIPVLLYIQHVRK